MFVCKSILRMISKSITKCPRWPKMILAGARPMTALQYLLELQRDWARKSTYNAVIDLVVKYGGAYGIGAHYAGAMLKQH